MTNTLIRILLILTALLYCGAFVLSLEKVRAALGRDKPKRAAVLSNAVYGAALLLNAGMIVYNYLVNLIAKGKVGFIPFVSMYQILIFLALCFFPAYLFIDKVCGCKGYKPYFILPSAVVMTGPCFMDIAAEWNFVPALQSPFFIPHIMCYILSYSLAAVAMLITLRAVITKEDHDKAISWCTRILFPFMTAGIFLGAIWADQVWGEFWAWDVKESWSLATWLCYAVTLHLFRREKTKKYARVLTLIGFALVVVTFFYSNVLKVQSVHSY